MIDSKQKNENISVIVRIKPKTAEDKDKNISSIKVSNSNSKSILTIKNTRGQNKHFSYDYICDEDSTQNDIFEHCGKKICDSAIEGYNCTIFAYGQTGSGKTYTLLGKNITDKIENESNNLNTKINYNRDEVELGDVNEKKEDIYGYDIKDERIGLLPRILYYLFYVSKKEKENKFVFKISYMEIYMETMIDLLYPDNKEKVEIIDIKGDISINNLRKLIINSPEEALQYIIDGNHFRHTGSTRMNNESSRSHALITIYIENSLLKENKIKKSVFHIIDLAGSESEKKSHASGERFREAIAINKSLLGLSMVIQNIINNEKEIRYRDCKLTHIVRDSLGGNAKTSIISTISQLECN